MVSGLKIQKNEPN